MSVIINIVLILISLVLIVAVLMQEGNKQGLGAIGGAAETFLGKNKSKSYEGKLLLITKVAAAIFVVIAILATWVNARSYTVKYYVDGEEYFPKYESEVTSIDYLYQMGMMDEATALANLDALEEYDEDDKRASYAKGEEIYAYEPPVREGYIGTWDKELPAVMDKQDYELNAVYTIGHYTVSVVDGTIPGATEGEAQATLCEPITATYGEALDVEWPALPEAPEGFTATWSEAFPETVPGYDMVIEVVYMPETIEEEATPAEATESEPVEIEATGAEATATEAEA